MLRLMRAIYLFLEDGEPLGASTKYGYPEFIHQIPQRRRVGDKRWSVVKHERTTQRQRRYHPIPHHPSCDSRGVARSEKRFWTAFIIHFNFTPECKMPESWLIIPRVKVTNKYSDTWYLWWYSTWGHQRQLYCHATDALSDVEWEFPQQSEPCTSAHPLFPMSTWWTEDDQMAPEILNGW